MPGEDAHEDVSLFALAHLIGEFIDYLDVVGEEYEKSVGLTRTVERERILGELSTPTENAVEQAAAIIAQWREIDRHSPEEFNRMIKQQLPDD